MSMNPPKAGMDAQSWGRLAHRAYVEHFLPDAVADPKVNAAMRAYHDAVAAYHAARDEPALTMGEREAIRADRDRRADLLEKGKDDASTPNTDRYRAEWRDHELKVDALALVITRRENELRKIHHQNRQALIDAHRANAEKIAADVAGDLDAIAAKLNNMGQELRKSEWATQFPDKWRGRPKTWKQGLVIDRPRGGDVVFSDSLIDPLRAVVANVLGAPEGPDPDAPKLHITADLTGAGLMAEKAVA